MVTLPITKFQMIFSMLIIEVWLVSDPKYSVKIGDANYFSLGVATVLGVFFVFMILAIKLSHTLQFQEEKIPLGKGTITSIQQKKISKKKLL